MKSFCPHCGTLMNYVGAKPNFCSSCGGNINSLTQAKAKQTVDIISNEEEEEVENVPKINGLEIEIQEFKKTTQTFGNVMESHQNIEPSKNREVFAPVPQVNKKQFLEDFQKEAGTLRPKD